MLPCHSGLESTTNIGIIPKNATEATITDQINGNTKWGDAIETKITATLLVISEPILLTHNEPWDPQALVLPDDSDTSEGPPPLTDTNILQGFNLPSSSEEDSDSEPPPLFQEPNHNNGCPPLLDRHEQGYNSSSDEDESLPDLVVSRLDAASSDEDDASGCTEISTDTDIPSTTPRPPSDSDSLFPEGILYPPPRVNHEGSFLHGVLMKHIDYDDHAFRQITWQREEWASKLIHELHLVRDPYGLSVSPSHYMSIVTEPLRDLIRLHITDAIGSKTKLALQDLCTRKWMLSHYHNHAFTAEHDLDLSEVVDHVMVDTNTTPETRGTVLQYVCMILRDIASGEPE